MVRKHSKKPVRPAEAIEPPSGAEVVIAVVSVTLLVLILGALSQSPVWLLGLLVFLPAAASALCTVRQTKFVSAWTGLVVIVTMLVRHGDGRPWLDRFLMILLTLVLGAASVYACHRRISREREMIGLRSTAAAMQRHILRPLPMLTDDVLVNGVYEPVQEDRLVGGDIYDVVDSPWGTRVLIGDVQERAFRRSAPRSPSSAHSVRRPTGNPP